MHSNPLRIDMNPIDIAQKLIAVDSVTSHTNAEIAELQTAMLQELAFEVETLHYRDIHGCDKICLAAHRPPISRTSNSAGIAYFCHNDVVSIDGWNCQHGGPFDANIADGRMWGRGACDMKGPTAAALAALYAQAAEEQIAPLYFMITGDEECGMAGARLLMEQSSTVRTMLENQPVAIIGEPTELNVVNAHKGGCHFTVSSHGIAAHSSTSEGLNANWQLIPFLNYLCDLSRRCETEPQLQNHNFATPTLSLNIVVENEPAAFNITVGRAACRVFFRPMPDTAWEGVLEEIKLRARDMELEISSIRCLQPLCTPADRPFVQTALQLAGQEKPKSVCFATDGCGFDELHDLLVIGPGNIEQAHRPDEWIDLRQLQQGMELYSKLFRHYAFSET
jgi:acetylornithine deacetylase